MHPDFHLYYRLDENREPVKCSMEELDWSEKHRRVGRNRVGIIPPRTLVSTVFLGLNHQFGEEGPPVLFETLVSGPCTDDDIVARYHTWDEAEQGHRSWVRIIRRRRRNRFSLFGFLLGISATGILWALSALIPGAY